MLNVYADTTAYAISVFGYNNAYIKIVFQEDWVNNHTYAPDDDEYSDLEVCCALIIDLNGHTCDLRGYDILNNGYYTRVRDSSVAQTGKIVNGMVTANYSDDDLPVVSFVLESGTIESAYLYDGETTDSLQAYIYGGAITRRIGAYSNYGSAKVVFHMQGGSVSEVAVTNRSMERNAWQMQLSPYIAGDFPKADIQRDVTIVARNLHFAPFETLPYDYYAVSSSDSFVGAYNYVYGYAWEKNADEMANIAVPADKTYYVWGRTKDGWYHCLEELHYVDGKLVVA